MGDLEPLGLFFFSFLPPFLFVSFSFLFRFLFHFIFFLSFFYVSRPFC
jgi:hypothetical protein